jgi:hypothetical protein
MIVVKLVMLGNRRKKSISGYHLLVNEIHTCDN